MADQPFWITLIVAFMVLNALLVSMAYMTWFERRVLALMQGRLGPNRTGPFGLFQPLADGIKLLGKEDIIPRHADRRIFVIAPLVTFVTAPLAALVIPFGDTVTVFGRDINLYVTDINVAALYVLGISSVAVYGIILGGYSSASRYSLLGALRGASQVISYEIVLGLSLIGVFILTSSLSLLDILNAQRQTLEWHFGFVGLDWTLAIPNWFIFSQPLGFVIFMIAGVAETNRPPFDLPEAETELTGGFHTEYSGFRWSFYFLGEFISIIVISLLAATLFLGGIDGPIADGPWWLSLKTLIFLTFFVWLRATLPRFRYDQLMGLAWKVLLPLVLANILITGFIVLVRDGHVF